MAHIAPTVDALGAAFRALPDDAWHEFMERITADAALGNELADLTDLAVEHERRGEPTRRLDDVLADLNDRQCQRPGQ